MWLKIDDQYADHPKIVQVGPLAAWLHTCALCYCARYLTDGFVPANMVGRLTSFDGIGVTDWQTEDGLAGAGHDVTTDDLVPRLLDVGLWEKVDGGYMMHDYLEYNPSREQVMGERQAAKERMAKARAKQGREQDGRFSESSKDVREKFARTSEEVTPSPSPSPSPNTTTAARDEPGNRHVVRLFEMVDSAGMNTSESMDREYLAILEEVGDDMPLLEAAFQEAALSASRPSPKWLKSVIERCKREGVRPGEWEQPPGRASPASARASPAPTPAFTATVNWTNGQTVPMTDEDKNNGKRDRTTTKQHRGRGGPAG